MRFKMLDTTYMLQPICYNLYVTTYMLQYIDNPLTCTCPAHTVKKSYGGI